MSHYSFSKFPEWKNLCFWFFEKFQNQRTFGSGFFFKELTVFHGFFENSAYVSNLVLWYFKIW
jgi:hypothetical protein